MPIFAAMSSKSFRLIITVTALAFVVAQLDVTIVNIALPQIASTFHVAVSTLQWVVDAYTIAFAVLLLSAGSLSDRLGATRIFQLGMLIFMLASIGCGCAGTALTLIIFRVIQGIGAATMIPSSLAILNLAFAHEHSTRVRAIGFWTAAGSTAMAAGPIAGGLLIHFSNWRFIFFVNIPLCLAGLLYSLRLAKIKTDTIARKFDVAGTVTWTLCITILIAAIIEWPKLSLENPLIYGGLVLCGVLLLAFLQIQKRSAHPMLPLHLFDSSTFNVLLLLGGVLNGCYYGVLFVISLYLQNVLHYPSLSAGLAFLPLTAGFVISNLTSGKIINRYGIRLPILVGLILFAAGFSGLLIAGADTPYRQLCLPFLTISMGMGLAVPAMTGGILAGVDKALSATASAALNTVRQTAGAIGVAVFGAMSVGGSLAIVHAITISVMIAVGFSLFIILLTMKYIR
jgi:DHA2 family methylenomycin A resistance protein-like MFS transporter